MKVIFPLAAFGADRRIEIEAAADVVLDTDGLTIDEVADMVVDAATTAGGVPR